jgi:hypothetical protein
MTSKLRAIGLAALIAVVGVACFIAGAVWLAIHPDHRWTEITGEPEHGPASTAVPIEIDDVRP